MRRSSRVTQVVLAAALLLAIGANVSSAASFDVLGENFRLTWSSFTLETGAGNVVCPVTLEGSFHSASFPPTARTRVASISRGSVGTCSRGRATILSETLPWAVQYASFTGTLPNVTALTFRLVGAGLSGALEGVECLIRSSDEHPIDVVAQREEFGAITETRLDERLGIPLTGGIFCSGEAHTVGTGSAASTRGGEVVYIFLEERGVDVVNGATPPVENSLKDVTLAANAEATLLMVNRNTGGWNLKLDSVELIAPNAEKYELNNPTERCTINTELLRGRSNLCRIQIHRKAGTTAGQNSRVQIRYHYTGLFTYVQEFSVNAS